MRILLVTQYFWPEQFIINDLVKELVKQGHFVHVLTGKPNYPEGSIFPGYEQDHCLQESFIPGVDIFRAPLRARGKKSAKNLILNYFSFVINGLRHFPKAVKGQQFDTILVFGLSPVTAAIPAILLKRLLKTHLAFWIQDLWPQSLQATGYVNNRFLLWLVGGLVRWIYYCSDTLLVQSKAFKAPVKRLASKEDKIIYYPNSFVQASENGQHSSTIPPEIVQTLEDNFCLVFAGNLGTAQSLDTLLDAAKQLKHLEKFRLILVGSGSMDTHLQERIQNESLTQVILAGRYPFEAMPEIFNKASALVVSLKNEEIFSYTIPSKIQAYLAAGRPIIAALNGEGAAIVNESGSGFTCPAEDSEALVQCIQKLYDLPVVTREEMGKKGLNYFLAHFEMSSQAQKLIDILHQRVNE